MRLTSVAVLLVIVASAYGVLAVATMVNPVTGMPASLVGKVLFTESGVTLKGGSLTFQSWTYLQSLIQDKSPETGQWLPMSDGHPTVQYRYVDPQDFPQTVPARSKPVVFGPLDMVTVGDQIVRAVGDFFSGVVNFFLPSARGQVAFDAFTTGSGTGTITISHNPVGTPRAAIVMCASGEPTDSWTAATYAGTAMSEIAGSPNVLAAGEGGNVAVYFLGSSVPTNDPASVVVTVNDATSKGCTVTTLTASADTELVDSDATINSTSQASPSVTLSLAGRTSFASIVLYSGQNAPGGYTPLTGWTTNNWELDIGTNGVASYLYNTINGTDVTCGWTQTADDAAAICVAVTEVLLTRYLVLGDAGCTVTALGTDAGCWASSSGGAGGAGVPTAGYSVFMDALSGAGTGTLDAGISVTTGTYTSAGFTGTFVLASFSFTNTASFTHNGGTITISTGTLDVGAATVSASLTTSGAASITMDSLTLSGSVIAKGTASLTIQGALTMSGGDLTSTSGAVSVTGNVNISSALSAIDFGSESWTVSGTWTNASTDATWDAGTGTVLFDAAAGGTMTFADTNLAEDEFNNVTFTSNAGTSQTFTLATRGVRWGGTLTATDTSGGTILAKATLGLTGGALTVSGTAASGLTSTSGVVVVTTVSISTATAYIDFGSETWTVSGTWTNSTTSASWDAGTGTVTFTSTTGGTMTFAGLNLAEAEFNGVTFTSAAGTAQTFTMATRGVRWLTTLSVTDGSSTTELATAGLALGAAADTPALSVGNGGILTANASAVVVSTMTMTGGTSGALTVTTGLWTVSGNWDTSGAGSTFTEGSTSLYTFDATTTITLLSTDNTFSALTVSSGIATLGSDLVVTNTMTISGGTTAKTTRTLAIGALTMSGGDLTSISGAVTITGNVNISSAASAIDFGSESWGVSGTWTNASTDSAGWDSGTGTATFSSGTGGTMTFAGLNLAEAEFSSVTFASSAGTPQTFTMATQDLQWAGTLTVSDGSSTTELATAGLGLSMGALVIGNGGILTANASTVAVASMTMTGGASGTLTLTTGAWTVSGNWDTSGAGSTFTEGLTSLYTFAATASITLLSSDNTFSALTVSAGTATLGSDLVVTNTTTISGGTIAKNTRTLAAGALTMSGGDLTSTSGAVTVTGAVSISSAASAIDFGSETWSVSGTWTNDSTDSAVWEAGTGTVTFSSVVGGTVTFAGSNLSEPEFNNVTFTSSAGTPQTFTMATRALQWAGTLSASDGSSTTELATVSLGLSTGALVVGNGGILTANASTVVVASVTMAGGASGTLTVTTGVWTISGSWNTSGIGSTFAEGSTSVYTFDASATITLLASDNTFSALSVSGGTRTLATNVVVTNALTLSGGTLAKSTFTVSAASLTMSGGDLTSTSGNVTISGNVNISSALSAIDFGSESWSVAGTWTNASTDGAVWEAGTGTVTFTSVVGGTMTFAGVNLSEAEFNHLSFNSSAGTAQTFTMATRSLRIGGTLTVTDSTSTTTLDTANLNLQANDVECAANGIILIGTGDFVGLTVLNIDGSLTMDIIVVSNMYIARTAGSGTIDITAWTAWTSGANVDVRWTFSPSVAGDTWQFVLEDVTASTSYDLKRNAGVVDTQTSVGTVITLSRVAGWAAGDAMAIDETPVGCGAARFWVNGTGSWSSTAQWSDSSGGASGCDVPTASNSVTIDAASCVAACTITVDVSAAMASLTTTGFNDASSTLVIGTFNFAVSGAIIYDTSNLAITVGASATNGLTATGTLTMTGGANISCGVAACDGDIDGAVSIDATSFIDFGSGLWNFGGTWTNNSTTASWDAGTGTTTFDAASAGTMTFAGANLSEAEFNNVTFTSAAGTPQTFTMATRALRWSGTLTVSDGSSTTELATAGLGLSTAALVVGNGGILTANASTVAVTSVTMTGGTSGTVTGTTGAWTISGSWNTSGAGSTFTEGSTSLYTFDTTASIILLSTDNTFSALTVSGGTATLATNMVVTNALTISGGTLAKSTFTVSVASLAMSGGDLTSTSGNVTITGNVNISSALSAIDFGSENWTVSGTWTNASTDGAVWEAGTGTVLFDGITGGTMTFAGINLSEAEFNNVTFNSSAGTPQTFTMATRGIRWLTTLFIIDGSSTTALATSDLAFGNSVDVSDLSIGNGGILTANASTAVLSTVTMTGGTSGTLTVTTGSWTISGNWNTSGAGSTFSEGTTSLYTFDATATITLLGSDNTFSALTVTTGIATLGSNLVVTNTMTISGGTVAKNTQTLAAGALTMSGGDLTSTSGSATITGALNISAAGSAIDFGSETWTVSGAFDCSSTDTTAWEAGTGTIAFDSATGDASFTPCDFVSEAHFNNATFQSSAGTPQAWTLATRGLRWATTLTVSDTTSTTELATAGLSMDGGGLVAGNASIFTANASAVTVSAVTMTGGASGTIVVTTGTWTVTGAWDTSGTGSTFAEGTTSVFQFNGTFSIALLSTDNTFSAMTVQGGTVTMGTNWVVANALTVSGGILAKSTFTFSAASLTMSGGDLTSTSGTVSVTGNVNISSALSAIDFGSEAWTVTGTWTNASTDGIVWEAGTGTVTFTSVVGGTMTFAGSNLSESEFNHLTFNSSGGTAQTFTMATRSLRIAGTLTVTDSTSTTTLDTANLNLQANDVECAANGIILVGTGDFVGLTVFNIDGSLTMNAIVVSNMYIARTAGTGTIDITTWTAWASGVNVDVRWTFSPSVAGDTWQFVLEDVVVSTSYDLKRNAGVVDTQTSVGTVVTLSRAAGWAAGDAMAIDETPVGCGAARFWVNGTGSWSSTAQWSDSSGGASGCDVPTASNSVTIDAASCVAACTITVDVSAAMASLTTTGFNDVSSTLAIGTFNFAVSGAITYDTSNLAITVGASATNGLTATGTLTMTGGANISCGAAACDGDIDGAVSIDATSFIDFGSGLWNFGGTWTNNSTTASWDAGTGTTTFDAVSAGTMTFAGANLSEAEFNSVTFTSAAGTPQTFTMATRALRWSGTLTVSDGSSTTELATAGLGLSTAVLVIGNGGILTANASTVAVTSVTVTGGASGTITVSTGLWTISGPWNTSGAGSTFAEGSTSLYTFDVTATITLLSTDNTFSALTVSGGTATLATNTVVTNALTISGGTLAKSAFTVSAASLAMSGGDLTSTSGNVTITGNVNISSALSAIDFGSENWTVSGTWTNASTDGAVWEAGTGTVLFDGAAGGTMTFVGINLSEAEFNNVTFTSSAGTPQTFTMATRGIRWLTTLSVADGSSTTALATTDLAVGNSADTSDLSVGNGGTLTANASTVVASTVTMTGGTSGTLTVTTGSWTISGNWNTSGAGSTFSEGTTSLYTFDATATITLLGSDNTFSAMTVQGGTVTMGTNWVVANALTVSGGILAKSTFTFSAASLTMSGGDLTSTSGTVSVTGNVNISSALSAIDFGSEAWNVTGTWTNASTDGVGWEAGTGTVLFDSATGGTMTFAGINLSEAEFNNVTFNSSAGTAQTFTMSTRGLRLGGTLNIADGVSTTALNTTVGNLAITSGPLTVGAGGILTANGSTITIGGNFNFSAGTFTFGTSTVVFAVSGIITSPGATNTMYFRNLTVNASVVLTLGDDLGAQGAVTVNAGATISGPTFAFQIEGSLILGASVTTDFDLDWDNTTAIPAGTYNAILVRGNTTPTGNITTTASCDACTNTPSFFVLFGTVVMGANNFDVQGSNGLALSSTGGLTFTSGTLTATRTGVGTINAGFIQWGSSTDHTVSGLYNNATTSASWDAGTGTVTFTSATGGTMLFAGSGLAEAEFNNVTFSSSAGTAQTFTMSTRGVRWLSTLSVVDASSTTALATSDLVLGNSADTPDLSVGNGGILTANASTVVASTVTMTGGTSGTLTVTTGVWTISGNWNTSGAGSSFDEGTTSTYTFDASAVVTLLASDNTLTTVTVSDGTVTQGSAVVVDRTLTVSGGTLAKSTFALTVTNSQAAANALILSGGDLTSVSGAVTISGSVNISSVVSAIDFGSESWSVAGTWTNASTDAVGWEAGTGTVTFTSAVGGTMTFAGSNLSEAEFNHLTFNSSGGTVQTFTMATRSLRIVGTLTVTDSTSTTTLDTSNLNLQANDVECAANGIILVGTGDFVGLTVFNIDGSLTMNTIVVSNMYIARTAGTGTIDITTWTAWAVGADVDVRWTFSPSVAGDTWQFILEDVIAATDYDLTRNVVTVDTQTSVGTVITLSRVAGWATGDAMAIDETPLSCVLTTRYWVGGVGNWNDTAEWSDTSGGAGGCSVPTSANAVFFNGSSGGGTATVNVTATMASFSSAGYTGVLDIGSFTFTVSTTMTHSGGSITISTGDLLGMTTLNSTGTFTMDGVTVPNLYLSVNVGTLSVTQFIKYDNPDGIPDIRWVSDVSSASASLTVTITGLNATTFFALYRDNVEQLTSQSDRSGSVTFVLTNGWSLHELAAALPGLSLGTGGGGWSVLWTWRHRAQDLTVEFRAVSPTSMARYEWLIDDGVVGQGFILVYEFQTSGLYTVTLKTTIAGIVYKSSQEVSAKSLSFVGQHLPELLVFLVGIWYAFLTVAVKKRDKRRKWFFLMALTFSGAAYVVMTTSHKTIPLAGWSAVSMYAGAAMAAVSGVGRNRARGLLIMLVGLALLGFGLTVLFP